MTQPDIVLLGWVMATLTYLAWAYLNLRWNSPRWLLIISVTGLYISILVVAILGVGRE